MLANRFALSIGVLLVVGGCETPAWNKQGASLADFNGDKYQCMQQSQQQTSSAYVNRYGGVASSGQSTNEPLFNACMNARGWSLQRQGEVQAAVKALTAKQDSMCADPQFAPYYTRTGCRANQITFEQLADTSRISPEAKAIFSVLRNAIDIQNREWMALQSKYGGAVGAKRSALYLATAKPQNDRNNLDLYNGVTTWGEYNKRRQDIYRDYEAGAAEITS
jgi:hypothetical protein